MQSETLNPHCHSAVSEESNVFSFQVKKSKKRSFGLTKIFTALSEKVNLKESKAVPILMLKNIKINS